MVPFQVLRTAGPIHLVFFIVVIFMNSYYLLNLILAIVAMSYDQLERRAADERMAEEAAVAERERLEVRGGSNEVTGSSAHEVMSLDRKW